jgi:hypothetical protein
MTPNPKTLSGETIGAQEAYRVGLSEENPHAPNTR